MESNLAQVCDSSGGEDGKFDLIAQVKDEHVFDMPTPRPMGGTGGVIDLSVSFSSSAASKKGGNAAVTATMASAKNSA